MIFQYKASPIRSTSALAKTLDVSEHFIKSIIENIEEQYNDVEIAKKDGSFREINIPKSGIKNLQRRINSRIFCHAIYPDFLYGGIKGKDYHKNAIAHLESKNIINLDIENFFPNIKKNEVQSIFKHLFKFSDEVSDYLAHICTLRDALPQGACTSTHIANLLFFQKEYSLYKKFKTQGLVYTRLIDDITISSKSNLSTKQTSAIIKSVQSLIGIKKFKLKECKTRVTTVGNPKNPASVTGLVVSNKKTITIPSIQVDSIKKDVYLCSIDASISNYGEEYLKKHNKASGKVAKLSQINHPDAKNLRRNLRTVLPNLDEDQIKKLKYKIRDIKKKSKSHISKESYHKYFYKICVLLNIYQRTHKNNAIVLRKNLFHYRPTIKKIDIKNGNL